MKQAVGGIFSIEAIVIFIILACGLLLFSVSYSRSFKVKNELRRVVEQYEGLTPDASQKIDEVMDKYNYTFNNVSAYENACRKAGFEPYKSGESVFCVKCKLLSDENGKYKGSYYTIATFVNIDIPLIDKIFEMAASYLRIEGETAMIYSSGNNSEICKNAVLK